jgi:prepilin-type N-terminal cleavage/methylation domain-containing protein
MNSTRRSSFAKSQAFTLIELLTVIAIIGILAAILIPTVSSVRSTAKSARALSNAKQFGMAALLYAQDNRDQVLGLRDSNTWNGMEFMLNQHARYLAQAPAGNRDITINAHRQIVDPLVPEPFQVYGNTYPHTWAINRSFNVNSGRVFDGSGAWTDGTGSPRRLTDFSNPSRVIYAVSGGYEITVVNAANEALTNPPTGRQPIFYYHRSGRATPAVFLDGHTAILTFPIDPRLINQNYRQP